MIASWRHAHALSYFISGVTACFLGLTLAGSAGHRLALFLGVPRAWFDVDFIDPRAANFAASMQVLIVSALFLAAGRCSKSLKRHSPWMLFVGANPIAGLAGYLAYRLTLPFAPEAAYIGPANLVAMALGFPAFYLMALIGRRSQPR